MERVAIVFTGGTISMRRDAAAGGNVPGLDAAALLATVPELADIAGVVPIDRGLTPGMHQSFEDLFGIAGAVRTALADPSIAAAVVVQGTDTIEETSFFYDLVLETAKPVVVTGAMRAASDPGYDGPANIVDAVRCAADPGLAGAGCVVTLAGEIHAADDVAKGHATSIATFKSPNFGAIGYVGSSGVTIARRRTHRRHVATEHAVTPIALVTATLDDDGWLLRAALRAGAKGVVVAAAASGNTSAGMLRAAEQAMGDGIPVVLATRAASGSITPVYAFDGGGATWMRAGALNAGYLSAVKARVALALGLGAGLDRAGLAALFAGARSADG